MHFAHKASIVSNMGIEVEKRNKTTQSRSSIDDIQSTLEELMNSDDSKENIRKAAADSLITLDKYRREAGQMEDPDTPPEWFSPQFVARVVEYMRETFGEGGLIDAEAEGLAGASFELSQEGNG